MCRGMIKTLSIKNNLALSYARRGVAAWNWGQRESPEAARKVVGGRDKDKLDGNEGRWGRSEWERKKKRVKQKSKGE